MENTLLQQLFITFDSIKKLDENGIEYWNARELQSLLGYAKRENFSAVIEKAKVSSRTAGSEPKNHFFLTSGKNTYQWAQREISDRRVKSFRRLRWSLSGTDGGRIFVDNNFIEIETTSQGRIMNYRDSSPRCVGVLNDDATRQGNEKVVPRHSDDWGGALAEPKEEESL